MKQESSQITSAHLFPSQLLPPLNFAAATMELCVQTSVSANASTPTPRRSANFHPSIWGEHFLVYASDHPKETHTEEESEHVRLKEEVRKMLVGIPDKSRPKLELIDAIQRLGISYHFESEIETSLLNIYSAYDECNDDDDNDLYIVALRFRLLRQHGHYVSCDVFNKFKNLKGQFTDSVGSNVKGLLSLYEASNFGVHGENNLEEALMFATSQLESMLPKLSDSLAAQVKGALNMPIQKTLKRLGARQYISIYQEDETHNDAILNFAKLDFNRLQKLHQMELSEITKWWKELDCTRNFPFARDRLVEGYFWILGVYFEPHYGLARRFLTKVFAMTSIIDDIYDTHGTFDELVPFTDAIERWDIAAINQLPIYMRHAYQFLLDVYKEMEKKLAKIGKLYRVNYAKQEMKKLVRAYFQEACWFHNNYVPKVDEHMKVSIVSCGYMMLATTSLVGMGDSATKEVFDWVTNEPLIIRAASVICRLMDDMVGHEKEQERGHVASTVECYMKEHGASKQEAFNEFQKHVTNAWKDMNKECLNQTVASMAILERVLNLARVINLLYREADGYTNSSTKAKEFITSVLIHPVPL